MKVESKELWQWCKRIHKKTSLVNTLQPLTLSRESDQMISTIFRKLHQADKLSVKMMSTLPIETLQTLPEGNDFSYIKESIKNTIRKNCVHYIRFKIRLPNREFVVHVCTENTKYSCSQETRIHKILLWFLFVNEFVPIDTCSKTVDVYIYCISSKKYLPSMKLDVIDEHNVNTAFTTSCDHHTSVYIYREEEWYRALIHESFHNLGLDLLSLGSSILTREENRIKTYFPAVSIGDLRFNETYCEMWGRILNSMIFTLLYPSIGMKANGTRMNRVKYANTTRVVRSLHKSIISRWKQNIVYERVFSILQCVKLLNHFNMSYSDLINTKKVSRYTEKTQGFSYYILTSIYMVFLPDFLHFCTGNAPISSKDPTDITLNFLKTEDNLARYIDIITKNYNSNIMLSSTSIVEDQFKKNGAVSPLLNTNLRMSLLEA
jgi:hypothetical protein